MKSKFKNIIFDIDGTLYSAEPLLFQVYKDSIIEFNQLYPQENLQYPSQKQIISLLGFSLNQIYQSLFPSLTPQKQSILQNIVTPKLLHAIQNKRGFLFPYVKTSLKQLACQGFSLFIASNGQLPYIQTILNGYHISHLFFPVLVLNHTSIFDKGDILLEYQRRYLLNPHQTLLVGDRYLDFLASQKMNCSFIACQYGYHSPHESQSFPLAIHSFQDIFNHLT